MTQVAKRVREAVAVEKYHRATHLHLSDIRYWTHAVSSIGYRTGARKTPPEKHTVHNTPLVL
jgi:hypothetical protein